MVLTGNEPRPNKTRIRTAPSTYELEYGWGDVEWEGRTMNPDGCLIVLMVYAFVQTMYYFTEEPNFRMIMFEWELCLKLVQRVLLPKRGELLPSNTGFFKQDDAMK